MEGGTDTWTEFLSILQDFVPYRGRCPKMKRKTSCLSNNLRDDWGRGLIEHVIPVPESSCRIPRFIFIPELQIRNTTHRFCKIPFTGPFPQLVCLLLNNFRVANKKYNPQVLQNRFYWALPIVGLSASFTKKEHHHLLIREFLILCPDKFISFE